MSNVGPDVAGAQPRGQRDARGASGRRVRAHLVAAAMIVLAASWAPGTLALASEEVPAPRDLPSPAASAQASSPATTETSPAASPDLGGQGRVATRVAIPGLGIDLPIISGEQRVPRQGPDRYPPCDVALYHILFGQPGDPGATYLYAHARKGMFLPLLEAVQQDDGAALLGAWVEVYTSDGTRHVYVITYVKRNAVDYSLAVEGPEGEERLVLQTSEGPSGTVPKLQVLAEPVLVESVTRKEARPRARPRACYRR